MSAPLHLAVGGWLWSRRPDGAGLRLAELVRHAAPRLRADERLTWLAGEGGVPELPTAVEVRRLGIRAQPPTRRAADQRRLLPDAVRRLGITHLEAPCLPLPDLRRTACQVWTTLHDLRDLHGHRRRSPRLMRWLYRRHLRRANGLLVPSEATARDIVGFALDAPRPVVVPNGVRQVTASRAPAAPPTIVHIGHLEPRKNLGVLVDAAAVLLGRGLTFRLVLAGAEAGAGAALRRQVHALGLEKVVEFPGVIDDEYKAHLLRGCAAVAVPSHCEGFGLVALEGLAWGAPTVVADTPALVEVVGDAGSVLPADKPLAWADALAPLLSLDPGAERARRARAAAFGWDTAADRWLAAFRAE